MTTSSLRNCFPALVAHPEVAYLDSASTAQKPAPVIEAVNRYLTDQTANPGRGSYPWATRALRELAAVREKTARFLNAEHPDEIVFTAGATAALHAVAQSWGLANLSPGDEILHHPWDHASTIEPWRSLGVRLVARPGPRTRLATAGHLHNASGAVTTLDGLDDRVLRCFDCSQSGGHLPVDVRALRADFAVLSGHKMFGLPGTGVLYVARRLHRSLRPFLPGGNTGSAMPALLEGGSVNLPGIVALGAAIDFIDSVGLPAIAAHDRRLTARLVARLEPLPAVSIVPGAGHGIVSFTVDGISAADVGFAAAARDIFVRTGNHCLAASPVETVRVSTHVYSTPEEIDRCADLITEVATA